MIIDPKLQYEVELLKELTWCYVINEPSLATLQQGQREVVKNLFAMLYEWLKDDNEVHKIPVLLREHHHAVRRDPGSKKFTEEMVVSRAVCDYICGLTDPQCVDMYLRMTGASSSSLFGTWFN